MRAEVVLFIQGTKDYERQVKTMNVYDVINGNILRIAKSYKFESKVLKGLMLRDKRLAILSVNSVNIYTN